LAKEIFEDRLEFGGELGGLHAVFGHEVSLVESWLIVWHAHGGATREVRHHTLLRVVDGNFSVQVGPRRAIVGQVGGFVEALDRIVTYACGMPRKPVDPRPRAELLRQMAAINLEIAEARRTLSKDQANAEVDRLTKQLKKLDARFLG
jgi:hypothetical protein